MRNLRALAIALSIAFASNARATTNTTFAAGSLIIPMDTDYQDAGMLKAFGLLDKLLRAGVTVNWCIVPGKTIVNQNLGQFTVDFVASATDVKSGAVIANHGYRGGPFVIAAADAPTALPIIKTWQLANTTAAHQASAQFVAPVSRVLTAAPRVAILADGNEGIAFNYLNAAGIPDEKNATWSINSPSVLSTTAVGN